MYVFMVLIFDAEWNFTSKVCFLFEKKFYLNKIFHLEFLLGSWKNFDFSDDNLNFDPYAA